MGHLTRLEHAEYIALSISSPLVLFGMLVVGAISLFILRAHVRRPVGRWIPFLCCVVGFCTLSDFLVPKIVE